MKPMREVKIEKVTLNIGVGEGGDKLSKAERVLEGITGRKPARTQAKRTIREWGIKQGASVGCKVTLRGEEAEKTLKRLFDAVERRLNKDCFDDGGNFAFGIREHIDIPGVSYDPEVGLFGMDVCVTLRRPGYRTRRRRRQPKAIPKSHRVAKEEAINFIAEKFGVQVV
ncbi:MAG: 50S ribosomal protein L5 [Candidatus Hadarchaeaceae archaeon]